MKYSCEIIKDLMPLYIDEICNDESKKAVEGHLAECEKCRKHFEIMKSSDGFANSGNDNFQDLQVSDSLKKIKKKMNRKKINIIIGAAAVVVLFIFAFVMFNMPIKEVSPKDVSISAEVYPLDESAKVIDPNDDNNGIKISTKEDETGVYYRLEIPGMQDSDITVSESVLKTAEFVTLIHIKSDYFLRTIESGTDADTLYISAFKTTVFNNKAEEYQNTMTSVEFKEINKIIFVDGNGKETVMWKNK